MPSMRKIARFGRGARVLILAGVITSAGCSTIMSKLPGGKSEPVLPEITSGRELISAMHDRYAGNWYRTLRFAQTNTFYTQSGKEEESRWVENLSVPGRLRIDFEPLSSKSGLLILNNRVTTFDNGKRTDTRRSIQGILTLTADVYAIPATVTLRRLDSLGIDVKKVRKDRLSRKTVYVIGARAGDTESSQAWIDAERMLLVRLIQAEKRGDKTVVTDTRVGDYRDLSGFPVAHEFMSLRDGKPYFRERYENVRVNEDLPSGIFDPSKWTSVKPNA